MGGSEPLRGYLIQTFIALIESLKDEEWINFSLEPENFNDNLRSLKCVDEFLLNGSKVRLIIMKTPGHSSDHICPIFVKNFERFFNKISNHNFFEFHYSPLINYNRIN